MELSNIISNVMQIPKAKIGNISVLKKGMTNQSFLFSYENEQYILRIPGVGTEVLLDKKDEAEVYSLLENKGICDHIIYFDADTGYKISKYYRNAYVCDPQKEDDVKRCMVFLRNFHQKKFYVSHVFDLWERINYYESLWTEKTIYADYEAVKRGVFQLRDYITVDKSEFCLCHIDAVPDNFLFAGNNIHLIDWEYAGMQDPHVDIAMFGIYSFYNREQIDDLIDFYFQGKCSDAVRLKIYCYVAICGLLWSNWCEYKRMCGVEFGEYAFRQYQYAKDYLKTVEAEVEKRKIQINE